VQISLRLGLGLTVASGLELELESRHHLNALCKTDLRIIFDPRTDYFLYWPSCSFV